jgi:hypothetical protein
MDAPAAGSSPPAATPVSSGRQKFVSSTPFRFVTVARSSWRGSAQTTTFLAFDRKGAVHFPAAAGIVTGRFFLLLGRHGFAPWMASGATPVFGPGQVSR